MKRHWILAVALVLSAGSAFANNYRLSVWMRSHWDKSNSVADFNTNNQGVVHEVNPMWYYFSTHTGSQGTVVDIVANYDTSSDVPTLTNGAVLVPTLKNHGTWPDPYTPNQYMQWIFRSEADMNDHADKVAAMVINNGWAGVDLDYEAMLTGVSSTDVPMWRDNFTSLVRRIKKRLPDKIVSVCVYRRRSLSGSTDSSNSLIYDYKALTDNGGADYLKIMMYNDLSCCSELVNDTAMGQGLTFAEQQIADHKKIIVALPWYAANTATGAEGPSEPNASGLGRSTPSDEQTFTSPYTGVQIDAQALRHKILTVITKHDVGGFAFYATGYELTGVWDVLRGRLGTEGATITAGTQSGTCPGNGIVASVSLPTGATSTTYNWFETQITCCAASYPLPLWVASGTPASPTLPRAFSSVRVSGIVGSKVFEAEADPIRSGCP